MNGHQPTESLDDLEFELRRLPGVLVAGFDVRDDSLFVQLYVAECADRSDVPIRVLASRIAARHSDPPVSVQVVRCESTKAKTGEPQPLALVTSAVVKQLSPSGQRGPRPNGDHSARLIAVLVLPDTDELEVHLVLDGERATGRAAAGSGLVGAGEATIGALRALGAPCEARAKWARLVGDTIDKRTVVAVALECVEDDQPVQYGLAAGTSAIDAAARATLDAASRLGRVLRRPASIAPRAAAM